MRRMRGCLSLSVVSTLFLVALPLAAQQGTINPRIPPPPPLPEEPIAQQPAQPVQPAPAPLPTVPQPSLAPAPLPPPSLPSTVVVPSGTRIAVVLDTPLSTRISKEGQPVTFRTVQALHLQDTLEIPPDTGFNGTVVKVRRPGSFGHAGELRVKVERMNLSTGATAPVTARLESDDARAQGQISSDHNRAADLFNLGMWTLNGTLLGERIKGGKGAAVGAGAGAAVALIIMASRRGPDVYLEPGMPFLVILDQPVELRGTEVFAAQQQHARTVETSPRAESAPSDEVHRSPDDPASDPNRPRLKRRPRNPQP